MSEEIYFDELGANSLVLAYAPNTSFIMKVLEPYQTRNERYRIEIYHKRIARKVIVTTLQEFLDIITMYEALDKDVVISK